MKGIYIMDFDYYKKFEPIDGKWYINKELGRGAFGTVLEVERRDRTNMKAAVKIISVPSSINEVNNYKEEHYTQDGKSVTAYFYGFVEEFESEFQLMAELRGHTNIVNIEDYEVKERKGEFGWDIFIRMELLTPMNKYFAQHKPSKKDVVQLGIDLCKALEVCQKHNIIHRDIKPSNIFVSENGDFKLGDFGVARTLEKTSSGLSKKGTYIYMAPEVYMGNSYGSNVDLYSLGIVMYKMLNDNFEPFRTQLTHSDEEAAMSKRFRGEPIPMPKHADGALAEIILKACCFEPEHRYHDPKEMREALESVLRSLDENDAPNDELLIQTPESNTLETEELTHELFDDLENEGEKTHGLFDDLEDDAEKTRGLFDDLEDDDEKTSILFQEDSSTEPPAVSPPKKLKKRKLLIGGAVALLLIVICCLSMCSKEKPVPATSSLIISEFVSYIDLVESLEGCIHFGYRKNIYLACKSRTCCNSENVQCFSPAFIHSFFG